MINRKKKNNKGFTLVELLVVIAIIGILAVVAVPSLFKNIDKAKASQVVTNVKALKTEILTEYADGKNDGDVVSAMKETNILSVLELKTNEGKLGESYSVVENGDATDGKVFIEINCKKHDKAEAVIKVLDGAEYKAGQEDGKQTIVQYEVGKK